MPYFLSEKTEQRRRLCLPYSVPFDALVEGSLRSKSVRVRRKDCRAGRFFGRSGLHFD